MDPDFKEDLESRNHSNPKKNREEKLKKHVHIILEAERNNKFQILKKTYNKSSDVEVLRMCIDDKYESMQRDGLELRPALKQQAEFLLQNEYLTNRYFILSMNDILNEAVHYWMRGKRSEINLHNTPFRQQLSEEEQRVALILVEKQYEYERGVSFPVLKSHLKDISEEKIQRILQRFSDSKLILENRLEGVNYYYAPVP